MLITIAIVLICYKLSPLKKGNGFLDEMREKDIKSIVTKKYVNEENQNIPYLVFGNKDSIVIYRDWWNKVSVGDSIMKPKGSLELIIKKSNNVERLNYEDKFGLE